MSSTYHVRASVVLKAIWSSLLEKAISSMHLLQFMIVSGLGMFDCACSS